MTKSLRTMGLLLVLPLVGGCGGGGGGNGDVAPPIDLGIFPFASAVIGQADFFSGTANQGGPVAANAMNTPELTPAEGSLYVSDPFNNRILGYLAVPAASNADADFVIGQADFVSNASGISATMLDYPVGVATDGARLAVADHDNNRVLLWSSLPTGNVPATTVVGQTDFTTGTSGTTASTLSAPRDVQLAGGRLFVVELSNNRVLIWNSVPTTNGASADVVLGQPDFTSSTAGTTAATLRAPRGLWTDGSRLVVADSGNHRVLIWNTIPTTDGAPADGVLGQADFTSGAPGIGASGLNLPRDVNSNGSQLFIADTDNHRVVIHDVFPGTNNRAADQVVGQSDFVHVAPDDDDQDGAQDGTPSARVFEYPTGVLPLGSSLLVVDSDNSRVLLFTP